MKIILLSMLVLLAGCAGRMTYDEMIARSDEPEVAQKLERFETDAMKADVFLEEYYVCEHDHGCMMSCDHSDSRTLKMATRRYINRLWSVEQRVRWYREMRHNCWFGAPSDVY